MKLTVRHLIRGTGQHRATTQPAVQAVLTEATLTKLLDNGDVVANESADCPACERNTFHAMFRDGSRRCWTCNTETETA